MKKLSLLILSVMLVISCSKDNKQAQILDGTWNLDKWSWEGKDTIVSGSFSGTTGTWIFTACKAANNNCSGTVNNFADSNADEKISWYIREKGTRFTMVPDNAGTPLGNLGGEWEILELSEQQFILTSQTCGSCNTTGKSRLEFSK